MTHLNSPQPQPPDPAEPHAYPGTIQLTPVPSPDNQHPSAPPNTDEPSTAAATAAAAAYAPRATPTHSPPPPPPTHPTAPPPRALRWRIYASHALSTWNSRAFEFAAVLFLAAVYPGTLRELSVYALVRSAAAMVFATPVGRAIDGRDRLAVVRFSIVAGRAAVILSCVGFWALYEYPLLQPAARAGIFAVLVVLACLEKVASVMNLVAVERDWVVVIAGSNEHGLQGMNARMRRIDLICKLVGPLFIALINGASTNVAIFFTLGLNCVSLPIEYLAIAQVYNSTPALHTRDRTQRPEDSAHTTGQQHATIIQACTRRITPYIDSFRHYFRHSACLPSFALALLYLTVLSFGGQMVTYLIAAGYNSFYIGLVRSLSVVFELSATWIAPRLMAKIGPVRAGIWSLSWQMIWLAATVAFFFGENTPIVAASGLAGGTILSRIGLWGYDLSAQVIIQTEVVESSRGSFSSTEASFQNAFEIVSYALTIVFAKPEDFKYPVVVSVAAVYCAGALFAYFVRKRRGHLVHVPCIEYCKPSRVETA